MWDTTPSAENLLIGKGRVYFERFDDAGLGMGMFHLGNVSSVQPSTEDDIVTKYSSMSAAAPVYKRVSRRRTQTIRLSMDEFHPRNVALVLMGEVATLVQAATAVVAEAVMPDTIPGATFFTAKLGPISAVAVKFGATTGVLGTDYVIVDASVGEIKILETTILTGAVTIDYTPTAYTSTDGPQVVLAGKSAFIEGRMVLVGDPTTGPAMKVEVWHVTVNPDGAIDFIGDDFGAMTITMTVQDDSANHPSSPLWQTTFLNAA